MDQIQKNQKTQNHPENLGQLDKFSFGYKEGFKAAILTVDLCDVLDEPAKAKLISFLRKAYSRIDNG